VLTVNVQRDRKGNVEVPPEFPDYGVYFHPIPARFQKMFVGVDISKILVEGDFGKCRDTGKLDKRNKKIFVKPFIITKLKVK
jgi:hypothetical protein